MLALVTLMPPLSLKAMMSWRDLGSTLAFLFDGSAGVEAGSGTSPGGFVVAAVGYNFGIRYTGSLSRFVMFILQRLSAA